MANGFWITVVILAGVALYVWAKVRHYMRQSDAQWREVDKSKLRVWEDDEESD